MNNRSKIRNELRYINKEYNFLGIVIIHFTMLSFVFALAFAVMNDLIGTIMFSMLIVTTISLYVGLNYHLMTINHIIRIIKL